MAPASLAPARTCEKERGVEESRDYAPPWPGTGPANDAAKKPDGDEGSGRRLVLHRLQAASSNILLWLAYSSALVSQARPFPFRSADRFQPRSVMWNGKDQACETTSAYGQGEVHCIFQGISQLSDFVKAPRGREDLGLETSLRFSLARDPIEDICTILR